MPPEEPQSLIALNLKFENEQLVGYGDRVFPVNSPLKVSWYTVASNTPEGYVSVLDGIAYVFEKSIQNHVKGVRYGLKKIGNRYQWSDNAGIHGLMIAMAIPKGMTLTYWDPLIVEAKKFADTIAVFWLLYPKDLGDSKVGITWSLGKLSHEINFEIERINRAISLSHSRDSTTDFDVALSFAGEDRAYVNQVAHELTMTGVKVFYDKLEEADLWGKNLFTHLSELYSKRARFTVMFISKNYAKKRWTNHEREAAQARAFADSREYILPVRFDNTEVPGMLPTTAYISANERSPSEISKLILQKLENDPN